MSRKDPKDYYARLGVDPSASADKVKSAYWRFAKEFHPDKNQSADAKARFQAVNEAYQTIGDPDLRAAYDSLGSAESSTANKEPKLDPVCCSKCGRITAQPRSVVFRYVVSIVVYTMRNPVQGIFCAACARKAALKASLISAIAGWWAFPWGPIYTVGDMVRNALGGVTAPAVERALLWHNALAFFAEDNLALSYALARRLRAAGDDDIAERAARLMNHLESQGVSSGSVTLKNPWRLRPFDLLAHALLVSALPLAIAAASFQRDLATRWTGEPMVAQGVPRAPTAVPSSKSQAPSVPIQSARKFDDIPPSCAKLPKNGAVLAGYAAKAPPGHHLEIKNGSGGDAIIKVRDAASGRLAVSFFVANNGTASFGRLPDGSYRIQYAFGNVLGQDCRSFVRTAAAQFPDIETMTATKTATQIVHTFLTYTLYPVPDGNVHPSSLAATDFDAE